MRDKILNSLTSDQEENKILGLVLVLAKVQDPKLYQELLEITKLITVGSVKDEDVWQILYKKSITLNNTIMKTIPQGIRYLKNLYK